MGVVVVESTAEADSRPSVTVASGTRPCDVVARFDIEETEVVHLATDGFAGGNVDGAGIVAAATEHIILIVVHLHSAAVVGIAVLFSSSHLSIAVVIALIAIVMAAAVLEGGSLCGRLHAIVFDRETRHHIVTAVALGTVIIELVGHFVGAASGKSDSGETVSGTKVGVTYANTTVTGIPYVVGNSVGIDVSPLGLRTA